MKRVTLLIGLFFFTFQINAVDNCYEVCAMTIEEEQHSTVKLKPENHLEIAQLKSLRIISDSTKKSKINSDTVNNTTAWNMLMHSDVDSQWKFGVKVGMNMNRFKTHVTHSDYDKFRIGYNFGFFLNQKIKNFLLQPGVNFCSKGAKKRGESIRVNYLEVPLDVSFDVFKHNFTNSAQPVRLNLAPYAAYALKGKHFSGSYENDIEFGENVDEFNRFDYGLKMGFSLQLGRLEPALGYDLGLCNLSNKPGTSLYNRGYYFNIAFLFGK